MRLVYALMLLLLPAVQMAMAQRGNIAIPAGAEISVPAGAEICADTIFANNPGYGTLTLANPNCVCGSAVIIPVEFLSISAVHDAGTVSLAWRTLSETNCAGYEVQRYSSRTDWQALGHVSARGSAREECSYSYEDPLPAELLEEPFLRYRLRQIDFDGAYRYSPAVEVRLDGAPDLLELASYPNPATDRVTLRFTLPQDMPASVDVCSVSGRQTARFTGAELSSRGEHILSINTTDLAPGAYIVELVAGGRRVVRQFILRR